MSKKLVWIYSDIHLCNFVDTNIFGHSFVSKFSRMTHSDLDQCWWKCTFVDLHTFCVEKNKPKILYVEKNYKYQVYNMYISDLSGLILAEPLKTFYSGMVAVHHTGLENGVTLANTTFTCSLKMAPMHFSSIEKRWSLKIEKKYTLWLAVIRKAQTNSETM